MTCSFLRALLPALVCWSHSVFAAAMVNVNFTGGGFNGSPAVSLLQAEIAGVVPSDNYNNVPSANTGAPIALLDDDGMPTTVSLSISGSVGGYSTISGAGINPQGPDEKLNTGFLAGNSTLILTGIPFALYDVYVYTLNDNESRVQQTTMGGISYYHDSPNAASRVDQNINTTYVYTLATSTNAAIQTVNANYVRFTGLSGANQTLSVSAVGNGFINGFQIVGVPEPTVAGGLIVGGLALCMVRRRGGRRMLQ